MPNYVINNIYLKGPQKDIDSLIALLGKDVEHPEEQIDFNNVVRMPESMNLVEGSDSEKYIAAYLGTLSDKEKLEIAGKLNDSPARYEGNYLRKYLKAFKLTLTDRDRQDLAARLSKDFEVLKPSSIEEVGKAYVDNIINYGADTWYDWSVKNWGCKWGAMESCVEDNFITYNTAWSAALPVTEKLSKMFPSVFFSHEFADEDIGYNCGCVQFEKGEAISEYFPKGEEAVRFACKIWDYDVTDYGLLPDGVEAMTIEEVIEPYNLSLKLDGDTLVLTDHGVPGSSYDGAQFNIDKNVIGNILDTIEPLTDEAYREFCEDLSKKGFDPNRHELEGLLTYVPTDTVNYGLMYNFCHCNEIMTIKALEGKSLEEVIKNATKESKNTESKGIEKDDIKEL